MLDIFVHVCFYFAQSEGVCAGAGQTEDARRLAHRAISYRPAMTSAMTREPVIKPAMMIAPHPPVTRTQVASTSHGLVDRADSGIGGGSASSSSPTTSLDIREARDLGGLTIQVSASPGRARGLFGLTRIK